MSALYKQHDSTQLYGFNFYHDHPREKFECPPGGLRTFEDVCTAVLVLPTLYCCAAVGARGDGSCTPLVCWPLRTAVGFVCDSVGCRSAGLVCDSGGLVGGGSPPRNIELAPPGGRRTLHVRTEEFIIAAIIFIVIS